MTFNKKIKIYKRLNVVNSKYYQSEKTAIFNLVTDVRIKIIILIIVSMFSACTFKSSIINRNKDVQNGKQFLSRFYKNVENEQLDSLDLMASDTLKKIIGTNGVSKIALIVRNKIGKFRSFTVSDSYTEYIARSGENETLYKYKLNVVYDKFIVKEIIGLKKQGNSSIQIISYKVYSDLLMH